MKAGTAIQSTKFKHTKSLINKSLITLCLTVFLLTTYFLLPSFGSSVQSKQEGLRDLIQNLLTNPNAFAQDLGTLEGTDQLTPTGYLNPLLPENVLPDFSINHSCNSSQTNGRRTIELFYVNRTEYRINLDRSTVRVGGVDVEPYSVLDATKVEELKKARISIVHTHFNSDLMVREVATTDKEGNQISKLEYKSKPEVLTLQEEEQDQWQSAGNNGPLDYLNPGRNTAMILEVPYNQTVVWTAGVEYSPSQSELDSGKARYQKTTTASTSNLKTCKDKVQSPNTLSIHNAPRTPFDLEIGRLTALTTTDSRTTSCRAENFLKGLNTKEVIGKGNNPLTLDYGTITTVGLGNRNMVTGSSDSIKNLPKNLKAGTYSIAIHTSENHNGVNKPQDVNESVFVQLFDKDKNPLVSSNATYDLGDRDNNLVQVVNVDLEIPSQAQYYQILHNSQEQISINELGVESKTWSNHTPSPFVIATDPVSVLPYDEFTSSNSIQAVCAIFAYHRPLVTIPASVLVCISTESNKQLALFKQDPRKLAQPNVFQKTLQSILQTCVSQDILALYPEVFSSINENQGKAWYGKYAQDGTVTPEEVRKAALELADRNEIRLVVEEDIDSRSASELSAQEPSDKSNQPNIEPENKPILQSPSPIEDEIQSEPNLFQTFTNIISGPTVSAQSASQFKLRANDGRFVAAVDVEAGKTVELQDQPSTFDYSDNLIIFNGECLYSIGSGLRFNPCPTQPSQIVQRWFFVGSEIRLNSSESSTCLGHKNNASFSTVFVTICNSSLESSAINTRWNEEGSGGNSGGGGQPPVTPEEQDIEVLLSEYLSGVVTEANITNTDFDVTMDAQDDSVWSVLKQIPESLVNDIDGFVYGDFALDCGSIGFVCRTMLGSAEANMIQMLAQFIWGMLEGMATFFTDFVDLIKMLWNIKDTISGLWGLVKTIFTDPMSLLSMVWNYFQDFIAKPIVEKIKFVGFIIGEQLKDLLVGLFTGGAGLAAKIGGVLNDVVGQIKSASKLATKGFNALEALVGQTIAFAGGIAARVRPGGKIGGDALSKAARHLDDVEFDKLMKKTTDPIQVSKLQKRRDIGKACGLVGGGSYTCTGLARNIANEIFDNGGDPSKTLKHTIRDGKLVWLEEGRPAESGIRGSGFRHINEEIKPSGVTRTQDLINAGVINSPDQIQSLIFRTIEEGSISSAIPNGTLYSLQTWNGKTIRTVVGDNGYIVTISFN